MYGFSSNNMEAYHTWLQTLTLYMFLAPNTRVDSITQLLFLLSYPWQAWGTNLPSYIGPQFLSFSLTRAVFTIYTQDPLSFSVSTTSSSLSLQCSGHLCRARGNVHFSYSYCQSSLSPKTESSASFAPSF